MAIDLRKKILPLDYYRKKNVVDLSKKLLNKFVYTNVDGNITSGRIIETEAYAGINDKACHAYNNKITSRTKTMYEDGGIAYIYLCYGIHCLFNIVVNIKGNPQAVLIRAVKPIIGIDVMLKRRGKKKIDKTLTNGPGATCMALGISKKMNALPLDSEKIWIEDNEDILDKDIIISKRIGIDYAEEDALLPYRFNIN